MIEEKLIHSALIFKSNFIIEILDAERVALISEDKQFLLKGQLYVALAKLLLKRCLSEKDITLHLSQTFPNSAIHHAISQLKKKKYITYSSLLPYEQEAFWHDCGVEYDHLTSLKNHRISIQNKGISSFLELELADSLKKLGMEIVKDNSHLDIYIVDNYISDELEKCNQYYLHHQKPWMLVKITGSILWIGPIFKPGKTGCWNCLANRIKENRRVEVDVFGPDHHSLNKCSPSILPTTITIALNLAANEAVKWLLKCDVSLEKHLVTLDSRQLKLQSHPFVVDPYCTVCACFSQKKLEESKSIQLNSCLKQFIDNEGERACTPEETLEKIEHVISPITGVLSKIEYLKVQDTHIYYTVRNLPTPSCKDASKMIRNPDVAVGKGKTKVQAKVGCIAEAIERHNCTYYTQTQLKACFKEIADQAIHPEALLNFSKKQYRDREDLNAVRGIFNQIPEKFYEETSIGWTACYSLIDQNKWYVPSSYCYLSYPYQNEADMCPADSNGCASGNTLEEAIFYAILELVERDAVAIWWYNRIKRNVVDLHSFENLKNHSHLFKNANREVHVLDITTDLSIPCFAAISWQADGKRICLGTGAHLNPSIGIARALIELNQVMTRANVADNTNLNMIPLVERDLVKWILNETIDQHPYLVAQHANKIQSSDYRFSPSFDFLEDINHCLHIFKSQGLNPLFLNMSNPSIPFCSVRVIIPGLRHFWARFAPGRLYQVPPLMGWTTAPLPEEQLNPIPFFL